MAIERNQMHARVQELYMAHVSGRALVEDPDTRAALERYREITTRMQEVGEAAEKIEHRYGFGGSDNPIKDEARDGYDLATDERLAALRKEADELTRELGRASSRLDFLVGEKLAVKVRKTADENREAIVATATTGKRCWLEDQGECVEGSGGRGFCHRHYVRATSRVAKGLATMDELARGEKLEVMAKIRDPKTGSRSEKSGRSAPLPQPAAAKTATAPTKKKAPTKKMPLEHEDSAKLDGETHIVAMPPVAKEGDGVTSPKTLSVTRWAVKEVPAESFHSFELAVSACLSALDALPKGEQIAALHFLHSRVSA